MSDLRCWQCGVEPTGYADVRTLGEADPRYIPTGWPPGDHDHAVDPPTPADLRAAGDAARARITREWAR